MMDAVAFWLPPFYSSSEQQNDFSTFIWYNQYAPYPSPSWNWMRKVPSIFRRAMEFTHMTAPVAPRPTYVIFWYRSGNSHWIQISFLVSQHSPECHPSRMLFFRLDIFGFFSDEQIESKFSGEERVYWLEDESLLFIVLLKYDFHGQQRTGFTYAWLLLSLMIIQHQVETAMQMKKDMHIVSLEKKLRLLVRLEVEMQNNTKTFSSFSSCGNRSGDCANRHQLEDRCRNITCSSVFQSLVKPNMFYFN